MKMKRNKGIFALVLALGIVLMGCPIDGGGTSPVKETFTGTAADGTVYTLTITDGTYVLKVGDKTSSGAAEKTATGYTLTPSNSDTPFTVTAGNGGITAMSGEITFDDGTKEDTPAALTPPPATDSKEITIEGGQVYTALNSPYSESGEMIGGLGRIDGSINSIGSVGLINSGILKTITIPADLTENSLISATDSGFFEIPGLKVGVLFFEVNNMDLRLHKEDGGRIAYIIYFDRDAYTDYYGNVKKGWHILGETAAGPENIQTIYDQGYKWTLGDDDDNGGED
jgi:hypothetical protein